jgi:uncharacterized membrane protein YdbT with pleckstrin-like domain
MPDVFVSQPPDTKSEPIVEKPAEQTPNPEEGLLASFNYYPTKVNFETQEDNEQIVLLLRQHPIVNVRWIVVTILGIFAPIILNYFPLLASLPKNYQFMVVLGWYLLVTSYALQGFLYWFFNVYIVTTERVVDVDFYNLIYKKVSDADLGKIQDVSYNQGGVLRTLLNYGDVNVQTAGELPNFDFEAVPHPDRVAKILQDLRQEEEQETIDAITGHNP